MSGRKAKSHRSGRKLTVYLFNVGQGDNILLRLPSGEYGLIDCFYDTDFNLPEPPALSYLKKVRRRLKSMKSEKPIVLSFVCLSHPDNDHVKGVRELLNWIKDEENNTQLKNLWMWPGDILEELIRQYKEYAGSTDESDSTHRASEVSRQLQSLFKFRDGSKWKGNVEYLQDIRKLAENVGGVKAIVVAPLGRHVKKFTKKAQRDFIRYTVEDEKHKTAQQNLLSSILMLIYKRHRLLFGGDTGSNIWRDCLNHYDGNKHNKEYGPLKGHFVKASHHGSKCSSRPEIWTRILFPGAHVGISAGRKSNYRHPSRQTLEDILKPFTEGAERPRIDDPDCPKIVATNTCHDCLMSDEHSDMPSKHLEWMVGQRPPLKPEAEEAFDSDRAEGAEVVVPEPPHKYLAAYIYRFEPNDVVKVYKGLSSGVRSDGECLFKTDASLPFPLCALRRP